MGSSFLDPGSRIQLGAHQGAAVKALSTTTFPSGSAAVELLARARARIEDPASFTRWEQERTTPWYGTGCGSPPRWTLLGALKKELVVPDGWWPMPEPAARALVLIEREAGAPVWTLDLGHAESLALAERALAVTRPGLRSGHAVQVPSQASGVCAGVEAGEPRLPLRLGQAQPGPRTDAAQGA
jgi:hypothetical protein